MRRKNISQVDLAKAVGVKQPSIAQLLSGRAKRTAYIGEIGVALEVSVYWLTTGKGQPANLQQVSWEARQVAKRYDALPEDARKEVVAYMDYVASRLTDPDLRELDPLKTVISLAVDPPATY